MSEKESELIKDLSNHEIIEHLREHIYTLLRRAELNYSVIIACFNEILKDIEKRMENKNE